jgi:hypothetical protein
MFLALATRKKREPRVLPGSGEPAEAVSLATGGRRVNLGATCIGLVRSAEVMYLFLHGY